MFFGISVNIIDIKQVVFWKLPIIKSFRDL